MPGSGRWRSRRWSLLERIGLFPGATAWVGLGGRAAPHGAVTSSWSSGNLADRLARRIGRTIPIVYGGGGVGAVAALRWKTQFNENAKSPAFWNQVPELCHNEICGWGQHGDVTRQVFRIVNLRHEFEHPQINRRFELVGRVCSTRWSAGSTRSWPRATGRWPSCSTSCSSATSSPCTAPRRRAIDPGPVPVLDEIKRRLAE